MWYPSFKIEDEQGVIADTLDTWELYTWKDWVFERPSLKTVYDDKVGQNGSFDLSFINERMHYNDRALSITLFSKKSYYPFMEQYQEMLSKYHGKRLKITEPLHKDTYVWGRIDLSSYTWDGYGTLTFDIVCEPFKTTGTSKKVITDVAHGTSQTIDICNDGDVTVIPFFETQGDIQIEADISIYSSKSDGYLNLQITDTIAEDLPYDENAKTTPWIPVVGGGYYYIKYTGDESAYRARGQYKHKDGTISYYSDLSIINLENLQDVTHVRVLFGSIANDPNVECIIFERQNKSVFVACNTWRLEPTSIMLNTRYLKEFPIPPKGCASFKLTAPARYSKGYRNVIKGYGLSTQFKGNPSQFIGGDGYYYFEHIFQRPQTKLTPLSDGWGRFNINNMQLQMQPQNSVEIFGFHSYALPTDYPVLPPLGERQYDLWVEIRNLKTNTQGLQTTSIANDNKWTLWWNIGINPFCWGTYNGDTSFESTTEKVFYPYGQRIVLSQENMDGEGYRFKYDYTYANQTTDPHPFRDARMYLCFDWGFTNEGNVAVIPWYVEFEMRIGLYPAGNVPDGRPNNSLPRWEPGAYENVHAVISFDERYL